MTEREELLAMKFKLAAAEAKLALSRFGDKPLRTSEPRQPNFTHGWRISAAIRRMSRRRRKRRVLG